MYDFILSTNYGTLNVGPDHVGHAKRSHDYDIAIRPADDHKYSEDDAVENFKRRRTMGLYYRNQILQLEGQNTLNNDI